ncbi:MAG: hypothetical protein HCA25_04530 [Dolichospermum sp. DET50]|nr:hypothetical protein [Dolichospermum sp. DET66]MBS3031567.1 hypothetical protein [Dolichospermum sp. DET67]MBS3036778.1 hypothetical protein [Dolichospermum sp. DET50]QSX68806.1 MAG: hypothetical protein EZY12_03700 [Dolichospermum sp. DET69]
MKKLTPTITMLLSCVSLISYGSASAGTFKEDSSNSIIQSQRKISPVVAIEDKNTQKGASEQPKLGTVIKLVNGDLMCYVTLKDNKGIEYNVGATFEICSSSKKFVNKEVSAVYEIQSVSDCQSAEPCGKTRKESIITKMEVVSENSKEKLPSANSKSSNSQTLSNDKWTITLSNINSWNGVNGTGNVSYQGCDKKNKCLKLTGGKISCRDGKCVTGWKNGDYLYILEQPITEKGNSASTLIVKKIEKNKIIEILRSGGLKIVPNK